MTSTRVSTSSLVLWTSVLLLFTGVATAEDKPFAGNRPSEIAFQSGGKLKMDLCSSGVELRGTDESKLRVSYSSKDGDDSRVKVDLKTSGSEGTVKIHGCPHNNFQITIEVPRFTDLYVRMWAGELDVKGITGSKDLELHAGELDVDIGSAADYAYVEASVMTGEVDAAPFDISKGGLFRSFHKSGPGKYRLHAHVGAGEVDLN